MRIVTWNVNSLKARRDYVSLFLDDVEPDVLCVQELKLETEQVPVEIFEERGYHVAVHGQRQWNGVLVASKRPIEDAQLGLEAAEEGESRVMAVTTFDTRIVNLYCPQGQREDSPKFAYKLRFYDALYAWLKDAVDPARRFIVTGDLNIAPQEDDVWDPERFRAVPSFRPEERERFADIVALGLTDVVKPRLPPNTYTFWDYRGGAFHKRQGMRIDHVLATSPLAEGVDEVAVLRKWRKKQEGLTPSDHAPVMVTFTGS